MAKVKAKSYTSPTLVLLAFDWPEAEAMTDFLGFAIKRSPGFRNAAESWLTNRIDFNGPAPNGGFFDSKVAPIQKFMWWDAQIDDADRGKTFTYTIWPVRGAPGALNMVEAASKTINVGLPEIFENKVGSWFNRAVVSSQAFSRLLNELGVRTKADLTEDKERKLRAWLANGLEKAVPEFLGSSGAVAGAIYHLEDRFWVLPALRARGKPTQMVFDARNVREDGAVKPSPNIDVVEKLKDDNDTLEFFPRDKANIMHDKILVDAVGEDRAKRVLCGSANFTSAGLSSQANVLHVWNSPELAALYRKRVEFLQDNPALAATQKKAAWSNWVNVAGADVRVCFAPEKKPGKNAPAGAGRIAMDPIIKAIKAAKSSVAFCLFTPTDKELRDACFAAGDKGLMMFGLVNQNKAPKAEPDGNADPNKIRADELARIEIYHRSRTKKDVIGAENFTKDDLPAGFLGELKAFPGSPQGGKIPPVIIHHKFIVIDAEGDKPVIFTGSANMSNNAQYNNDENLLHIKASSALAACYFSEFMRLYEHYRARADALRAKKAEAAGKPITFKLTADAAWAKKHFKKGSPEARARVNMAD